jgi:hypothetical protein
VLDGGMVEVTYVFVNPQVSPAAAPTATIWTSKSARLLEPGVIAGTKPDST